MANDKMENEKTMADLDPNNISSRIKLGNEAFMSENYENAIKYYTEAINSFHNNHIDPAYLHNPDFCFDIAELYEKRGASFERYKDIKKAVDDYKKVAILRKPMLRRN